MPYALQLIRITERAILPKVWGRARQLGEPLDLTVLQRALERRVRLPVTIAESPDRSPLDAICLALGPMGLRFAVERTGPDEEPELVQGACEERRGRGAYDRGGYASARREGADLPARSLWQGLRYTISSLPLGIRLGALVVGLLLTCALGVVGLMTVAPGWFESEPGELASGFHGGELLQLGVGPEGPRLRPSSDGGGAPGSGRVSGHGAVGGAGGGAEDGQAMLEELGSGSGPAVDESAAIDTRAPRSRPGATGAGGEGSAAQGGPSASSGGSRARGEAEERKAGEVARARHQAQAEHRAKAQGGGGASSHEDAGEQAAQAQRSQPAASPGAPGPKPRRQQAAGSGGESEPPQPSAGGGSFPFVLALGLLGGLVLGLWLASSSQALGPRREPWFVGSGACFLLLGLGISGWLYYDRNVAIAEEEPSTEPPAGPFAAFVLRGAEARAPTACASDLPDFAGLLCHMREMAPAPAPPPGPFEAFVDSQRRPPSPCDPGLAPFEGLLCELRAQQPEGEVAALAAESAGDPGASAELLLDVVAEAAEAEASEAGGPEAEVLGAEVSEIADAEPEEAAGGDAPPARGAPPSVEPSPAAAVAAEAPSVPWSQRLRGLLLVLLDLLLGGSAGTLMGGVCGYTRRWLR